MHDQGRSMMMDASEDSKKKIYVKKGERSIVVVVYGVESEC